MIPQVSRDKIDLVKLSNVSVDIRLTLIVGTFRGQFAGMPPAPEASSATASASKIMAKTARISYSWW
jgi:hypothetical protein